MDFRKIKKEKYFLFGIIFLSFIIYTSFSFTAPLKAWDETVYANLGYDLSHNPLDYSVENNGWSDWIPSGDEPLYKWPKMGFRAPLLPYSLAILYFLKLSSLVFIFMPLIGALGVSLIYLLGKRMFNSEVGIYSAIFLMLTPLYVSSSSKILTETYMTFFILLTIISFWKGYEEGNSYHKILFGFFFALALLARYTTLWFIPVFFFYFLIRTKSLKFILDKYLWGAMGVFMVTLIPWFIYGYFEYGNILGGFIHGIKAAMYWGGTQSVFFYFQKWWKMFSVVGVISILAIGKIFTKNKSSSPKFLILILWTLFFILMALFMPHKEERFILPIVPALCILAGVFIYTLKSHKKLVFKIATIILMIMLFSSGINETRVNHSGGESCFLDSMRYLNQQKDEAIIITDEFSVVHYYTKSETQYIPSIIDSSFLEKLSKEKNKEIYFLFSNRLFDGSNQSLERYNYLENNLDKVFDCAGRNTFVSLYSYKKPSVQVQ
jgi:4-amino-4-deoxy-L-arabinose transferase-like glycosyltransferase